MSEVVITKHALYRAKKRFGWNKSKVVDFANRALSEGVYALHDDTMREIMLKTSRTNDSIPYLFMGAVFVYVDERLVTIYSVTGAGSGELF